MRIFLAERTRLLLATKSISYTYSRSLRPFPNELSPMDKPASQCIEFRPESDSACVGDGSGRA